ncbi:hypothetical protein Y1Q_0013682 [Alligator mississippiensis]|uniref:Uncharacterized protein n=1 Tax=Alligator mississippiensis TaxID=8496 RepID=A0A151P3R5_ALLMI|nr:hypothetical protein Y1Q_0013682 [Alligator mississippiensis]
MSVQFWTFRLPRSAALSLKPSISQEKPSTHLWAVCTVTCLYNLEEFSKPNSTPQQGLPSDYADIETSTEPYQLPVQDQSGTAHVGSVCSTRNWSLTDTLAPGQALSGHIDATTAPEGPQDPRRLA